MKKTLMVGVLMAIACAGAMAASGAKDIANEKGAINAAFGKGLDPQGSYVFVTNQSSEPIYKVGALKDPQQKIPALKANGKEYDLFQTDPASIIAATTSVKTYMPKQNGEYAVKMTLSDEGAVATALSSIVTIKVPFEAGGTK